MFNFVKNLINAMVGFIILEIFLIAVVIMVAKSGKSLLCPNFELVDKYFVNLDNRWNTLYGKIIYYLFLIPQFLLIIGIIICLIFGIMSVFVL